MIEETEKNTPELRIKMVSILFLLKWQGDYSGREYAFFQYIDCMRPLDDIGKEHDFMCHR